MYCTPCARLTRSITPNTSVSPAAIRNSSTPNPIPFSACTSQSAMSAQRALLGETVGLAAEHLLHDLRLVKTVRPLRRLHQVEILDRVAVGVELEGAARGPEIRRAHRRAQLRLVGR